MQDFKSEKNWRHWTRREWNEQLFLHFFYDHDSEDCPVYRIPVTSDELAKAVSDLDATPQDIEEAFLETVRSPTHIDFTHRLARYSIDPKSWWVETEIPPYFFELAFSCLVASPPNGEIRSQGDFRKRLAMLLKHDLSIASYPLKELPNLWLTFSAWLDRRRSDGLHYRRLELPTLDYRKRIGYSVKLAFPSRKDEIILTRVLSTGEFEGAPTIPMVFSLVGNSIAKFSVSFRKAYEEFRVAFGSKEKNLERYPFWGAVREALASVIEDQVDEDVDRRSLKCVLEPDGVVLLLSTMTGGVQRDEAAFMELDSPYGDFSCVLNGDATTSIDFRYTAHRLLQGEFNETLSGRGWQAIKTALQQGLLLFKKTESLSWELTFTRQEEGDFQAFVKDSLKAAFLEAFPQDQRPYETASHYDGWVEFERFSVERLNLLTYDEGSPLADIRCLQHVASGPRLYLTGGCPIDGGYLGIPVCLPQVRADLLDSVQAIPASGGCEPKPICLTRREEGSGDFCFPENLLSPLEGVYRMVGSLHGRVLIRKDVVFRSKIAVNAYARPTEPSSWQVEAGGPDVIDYCEDANIFTDPSHGRGQLTRTGAENTLATSCEPAILLRVESPLNNWSRIEPVASLKLSCEQEQSGSAKVGYLMETLGGLAMRRKGIPEGYVLELIQKCLGVNQYKKRWDIVRAWVEGGYLDPLHYKKWRRTDYFARVPRFALESKEGQVQGVLTGLATSSFRKRVDVELESQRVKTASASKWIIPTPAWLAPSADPYVQVSKKLGLEPPTWTRPIVEILWSIGDVVSPRGDPPKYYERWGCWSWDCGKLSRDTRQTEKGVEVVRFQRPDRAPYYQVMVDGTNAWWSISRNWALLLAHELKGDAVFAIAGADQVIRISKGQLYLPLPIGRYLVLTASVPPSPAEDDHDGYVYHFRDSRERESILAAVWGKNEADSSQMGRWARWILTVSRSFTQEPSMRAVSLPSPIRQKLESFEEVPDFHELSRTQIAPFLIPRVRDGVSRFIRQKEV